MYENYKLCERLSPNEICFVVEQYHEGKFAQKFHEHFPKSRMSDEARRNVLRALVIHFSQMGPEQIVHCYLNERGKQPSHDGSLEIRATDYPEPGVLR
jgi:hypothetical protein